LRLSETFARILSRPESTIMSTLERTFQKGLARGRDEGRVEGRAEVILRLLQRRFGPLDESTVRRVQGATAAELDRIADRLLEHTTLAEVLAD